MAIGRALALAAATTCAAAAVAVLVLRRRRRRRETHEKPLGPLPDFARLPRIGWSWVDWKTTDENYLDLAYLLARNSEAKDGHMGCCVVQGGEVVATTINCGLFGDARSDVHAEAAAVSDCARRGVPLGGASIYVTRAPCPRCYKLVAVAGVCRVVSPTDLETEDCARSAKDFGMDVVKLRDTPDRARWRDDLAALHRDDDAIRAARERRKAAKRDKTYGKLRSKAAGAAAAAEKRASDRAAKGAKKPD